MRHQNSTARIAITIVAIFLGFISYYHFSTIGFLSAHLHDAELLNSGKKLTGHFGAPLLTAIVHRITDLSIRESYNWVLSFHVILTFLVLYHVLYRMSVKEKPHLVLLIGLSLALMIVAPIGLPNIAPEIYSFTESNRSTLLWRNTTHTMVQPYSILAFGYFCLLIDEFIKTARVSLSKIWVAGGMLFLSSLMKPSFAYSFIPALGIVSFCKYYRFPRLILLLGLITLPAVLLLLAQCYLFFIGNPLNSTLNFAIDPLIVWTQNNKNPLLALFLATIFPLYIMIARNGHLQFSTKLAGCNFFISCLPYALFSSTGDRDYEWSFWYGLQLLFFTAILEWLCWWREKSKPMISDIVLLSVGLGLFLTHTAFGLIRFIIFPF